jgi:hypothetical protein
MDTHHTRERHTGGHFLFYCFFLCKINDCINRFETIRCRMVFSIFVQTGFMEAIKARAKKNKKGLYQIELPADAGSEKEMDVMVIVQKKKKKAIDLSKFIGKFSKDIDWVAYQKKARDEWD